MAVRRVIVTAVTAGVLLVSACSDGSDPSGAEPESAPGHFGIKGTISVPSATYVAEGDEAQGFCTVKDGYEDLRTGASVVATDAHGEVVGVGALADIERTSEECRYAFEIANVPEGSDTYGIEVGNRGIVQYERSQLEDSVELPLE
jgi:hypothetical protein